VVNLALSQVCAQHSLGADLVAEGVEDEASPQVSASDLALHPDLR